MSNARILIAEDDLFLQQIYKTSLAQAGYDVTVVDGGEATLAKLKEEKWDMLLLDLNMPNVSGMDVLTEMKNTGMTETLPVIVLTNFSEDEYSEKCIALGAKAFFTKSNLSFDMILAKIQDLLKNKVQSATPETPAPKASVQDAPVAEAIPTNAPPAPVAEHAKRILVVEDDPFLAEIYKQNLQERGYDAVSTMTGQSALDILEKDKDWSVMLLDLLMPEMDGFTVLERLKEKGITETLPVIVLTNLSQENDQKKAKELGAVDFAIKSELSFDEIVSRVERIAQEKNSAPPQA